MKKVLRITRKVKRPVLPVGVVVAVQTLREASIGAAIRNDNIECERLRSRARALEASAFGVSQ